MKSSPLMICAFFLASCSSESPSGTEIPPPGGTFVTELQGRPESFPLDEQAPEELQTNLLMSVTRYSPIPNAPETTAYLIGLTSSGPLISHGTNRTGLEPYRLNSNLEPTLLADLVPGPRSSLAYNSMQFGSKVVFQAANSRGVNSIFLSDGSTAGTLELGPLDFWEDLYLDINGSNMYQFTINRIHRFNQQGEKQTFDWSQQRLRDPNDLSTRNQYTIGIRDGILYVLSCAAEVAGSLACHSLERYNIQEGRNNPLRLNPAVQIPFGSSSISLRGQFSIQSNLLNLGVRNFQSQLSSSYRYSNPRRSVDLVVRIDLGTGTIIQSPARSELLVRPDGVWYLNLNTSNHYDLYRLTSDQRILMAGSLAGITETAVWNDHLFMFRYNEVLVLRPTETAPVRLGGLSSSPLRPYLHPTTEGLAFLWPENPEGESADLYIANSQGITKRADLNFGIYAPVYSSDLWQTDRIRKILDSETDFWILKDVQSQLAVSSLSVLRVSKSTMTISEVSSLEVSRSSEIEYLGKSEDRIYFRVESDFHVYHEGSRQTQRLSASPGKVFGLPSGDLIVRDRSMTLLNVDTAAVISSVSLPNTSTSVSFVDLDEDSYVLNNRALFWKEIGSFMYSSDGSVAGTHELFKGSYLYVIPLKDHAIVKFKATQNSSIEYWTTDGTPEGTKRLFPDPAANSIYREFAVQKGLPRVRLFCQPSNDDHQLWRTDGTTEGTWKMADFDSITPNCGYNFSTLSDGHLYFQYRKKSAPYGTGKGLARLQLDNLKVFEMLSSEDLNRSLGLNADQLSSTPGRLYSSREHLYFRYQNFPRLLRLSKTSLEYEAVDDPNFSELRSIGGRLWSSIGPFQAFYSLERLVSAFDGDLMAPLNSDGDPLWMGNAKPLSLGDSRLFFSFDHAFLGTQIYLLGY